MASNRPRRRKQEEVQEPQAPKGRLNNMELLGIALFCIAFMLYGISKCGKEPVVETTDNLPVVTEEIVDSNTVAPNNNNNESSYSSGDNNRTVPRPTRVDSVATPRKLYSIADSLRVRKEPNLSGELITYLSYGEEVVDLGEHTVLEKLRVSVDEVRMAPWIKIKTKKGKIGWAFGAYMQFYPVARTNPNNQ
ncbi:SH3 domain-containing protein [Aureispira anguillae]|uniref:SH3 domain-containing protein n=1 Tax=Aureispira anguillae TaxID=2864201 RepID=A0A915YCW2_9BACT|nr:SH3 domain-containing protein [Aureispira anguillae]BDS10743.1 SH3 domain-containing protein [Aureispira anguillae]